MANSNFYANIGVNAGFTRSRSNTSSHTEGAAVITLKPMDENSSITYNNVNNMTYQGTQAQGRTFIYNNVANIQKEAVELHNSYSSSSSSRGINSGAEGSPINRDITRANEVTRDSHSSTNINVESQTIEYATNPAKLKEDIGKVKDEINDIKWAIKESIHDRGDDNRNFFGQLSEVRLSKTIDNITSQRLIGKTVDTEIADVFKDAYKDLGYDINIIFSDPKNSPQLLDENDKPKTGTAYVRDENGKKIKTIIINGEDPINATKAGLIGTIVEEGSHIIGKVEGRQRKTGTDEKGLESTGRASNEYFAEKYKDDNTPISIQSDGKDYFNVDFGENVGDKTIVPSKYHNSENFKTNEQKNNVIDAFIKAYGGKKKDYYYLIALNEIKAIQEFSEYPNHYTEVEPKEAVYHNMIGGKIKITGGLNRKFVNKENGREIVLTSDKKRVVKDNLNRGTFNYYTYDKQMDLDALKHTKDMYTWLKYETSITDKSTYYERINYLELGLEIFLKYNSIKAWAEKKKITHIGREELNQYYKETKNKK